MVRPIPRFLAPLLLVLAAWAAAPAPALAERLRLGLLAPDGSFDALHSWDLMLRHIAGALPDVQIEIHNLPHEALRDAIRRGEIDYFIANSGFFVEAEASYGASPVATLESANALSPTRAIATTIVARADDDRIQSLADLRGKRVVAVHPLAFGGYQLGLFVLKQAGVEAADLKSMSFTGLPSERLLSALHSKAADAVILRSCRFESLIAQGGSQREAFKVLGARAADGYPCARSSDLYPDWPFAMLPSASPALSKRLSVALLSMPRAADGHAWTVPTDYSGVHQVFRDLEIGPYANLGLGSFGAFVHRYRYPLALLLLALLGGALHIVRTESLVRKRTKALRDALADRDRIAQEARARERQLEHLSRLSVLGEMSTMLAHELNQPLSAIGNFARGIVRRIQGGRADPAALADAGDQIALQAERAAGILKRVRDFARDRPGERVDVDLCEVFEESLALFQGLLPGAARVAVELDPGCRGSAHVWADRLQISQVLVNLIKNACDAMAGLPPTRRQIRIACRRESGLFRVEVIDHGAGLQSMPVHSLFEPFSTTKAEGLGLGLAICRRVVEAHGGQIGARSNDPEPGLTVWFTLPESRETPLA